MTFIRIISIFIAISLLISCSASYEELIKSNYKPEDEISKLLLIAYKTMAEFEAKEMIGNQQNFIQKKLSKQQKDIRSYHNT